MKGCSVNQEGTHWFSSLALFDWLINSSIHVFTIYETGFVCVCVPTTSRCYAGNWNWKSLPFSSELMGFFSYFSWNIPVWPVHSWSQMLISSSYRAWWNRGRRQALARVCKHSFRCKENTPTSGRLQTQVFSHRPSVHSAESICLFLIVKSWMNSSQKDQVFIKT